MLNVERYKEEIKKGQEHFVNKNIECAIHFVRTGELICTKRRDCFNCERANLDWLAKEYKETIKLTKCEFDVLMFLKQSSHLKFNEFDLLNYLYREDNFQDVENTEITIGEILDNCELEKVSER